MLSQSYKKLLQAKIWWELYSVVLLKSSLKNFLPKQVFTWLTEAWAKQVPRSHRGDQSLCWTVAGEATRKRWETVRMIQSSRLFVEKTRRFWFLVCCSRPSRWNPFDERVFGGVGLGAGSLRGSRGFVEARSSRESKTAGWTTSCDSATWIKSCLFKNRKSNHLRIFELDLKKYLRTSTQFCHRDLGRCIQCKSSDSWELSQSASPFSQDVFVGAGWCVGCQSKARGKRHVEISRER